MSKNKKNKKETPGSQLLKTAQDLAREGYVALPARRVFGDKIDTAGKHWSNVYNALLCNDDSGTSINSNATSPVGMEVAVKGGSENLGYMSWGVGNRLPNTIAMLVSLLPYTAVGVKFNTDVIAGLGPRAKYRYNRFVNGHIVEEKIEYAAAGKFIQGLLMEKRQELMGWLTLQKDAEAADESGESENTEDVLQELGWKENPFKEDEFTSTYQDIIDQLKEEIEALQNDYQRWEETNRQVEELMRNNNLELLVTELANDVSHMGICFPEIQLDKAASTKDSVWNPKIIGINYRPCTTTRLERMDKDNRINYVYTSNQWLDQSIITLGGEEEHIKAIPAIDAHQPLRSLQNQIREVRAKAYKGTGGERPTHFVLPCYYPSMGRPYYPEPAWYSIFRGDIYRYTSTIIENRAIAKENSNSAGKIIYIHTEYLEKLYIQSKAERMEDKEEMRDAMWEEINSFLQDKHSNGQTILSFTFIGSDGKEHDAWRIVDVPINSKTTADANKTELEELSNIIFLALNIHSVLIGNSLGASKGGGTQQREMYELKKLLSVPTQQLILKPFYLFRDFNELDPHLEWEIGQMTLTTLDRNKNGMEETKV